MTKVTGWDNGLSQDYDKGLGRWFADRLGARQQLRQDIEMTQVLIDRATLEQLVMALEKSVGAMQGIYGGWRCTQELKMANLAITAGRAAIANAEPTGWQPIETAPATANNVLAFSESGNMKIETGHWLRNMLHAAKVDGEHCNYTHWMPLPAAPKDTP